MLGKKNKTCACWGLYNWPYTNLGCWNKPNLNSRILMKEKGGRLIANKGTKALDVILLDAKAITTTSKVLFLWLQMLCIFML